MTLSRLDQVINPHFLQATRFSSEPGVANEMLENEPKSCLAVASLIVDFYTF